MTTVGYGDMYPITGELASDVIMMSWLNEIDVIIQAGVDSWGA